MNQTIIIMAETEEWTRRAMAEPEMRERFQFFQRVSWETDGIRGNIPITISSNTQNVISGNVPNTIPSNTQSSEGKTGKTRNYNSVTNALQYEGGSCALKKTLVTW